jgi:hypothetical protein
MLCIPAACDVEGETSVNEYRGTGFSESIKPPKGTVA